MNLSLVEKILGPTLIGAIIIGVLSGRDSATRLTAPDRKTDAGGEASCERILAGLSIHLLQGFLGGGKSV